MNNVFLLIILVVFLISFALQLYYYLFVYLKAALYKPIETLSQNIAVSVIIAAKNEERNLRKNLESVLKQVHHDFEVIIVNDGSNDNSSEIISEFKKAYPNLKQIKIEKSAGKKNALTKGIEFAKHDHLLFIDADCKPVSSNWISLMSSGFDVNKDIILGYGAYENGKGFLKRFIRYDSFFIALQYFGAALTGNAYMGVGRNLAYKKALWKRHGGFEKHKKIISGDDDLFIIAATTKTNTGIVINPESKTASEASESFSEFCRQKSRHFSTTKKYNFKNLFFAGGEIITRSLFYFSFFALLFSGFYPLALLLMTFRLTIKLYVINNFALKTKEKFIVAEYIFFDIFAIAIYLLLHIYKLLVSKTANSINEN